MSENIFERFYSHLSSAFGPQYWWPGETRFEIIVGAILTQNTNWSNVELALENLKRDERLDPFKMYELPHDQLAELIRPSGYFNVKAKRLRSFLDFLMDRYDGCIDQMESVSLADLRRQLLNVKGIGPETADSILLYAFNRPVFVIDAYTKRLLYRHGVVDNKVDYPSMQLLFMTNLPTDVQLFNEFHALIVKLGKEYCRPTPQCSDCPLKDCEYSLVNRCAVCHRQLIRTADRALVGPKLRCEFCI